MSTPNTSPIVLELLQWPRVAGPGARRITPGATDRDSVISTEIAFAAGILSGALALVYAIAGATLVGTLPVSGAILLGIAGGQVLLAICVARGAGRRTLLAVAATQLVLAGAWLASRSVGLPFSGAPHPVSLLDALVAADELLVAVLVASVACRLRKIPLLTQLALVLAAVSLTALATGHTHGAAATNQLAGAPGSAPLDLYCRLL